MEKKKTKSKYKGGKRYDRGGDGRTERLRGNDEEVKEEGKNVWAERKIEKRWQAERENGS